MKKVYISIIALSIAFTINSCKKEFKNPVGDKTYTSGSANFTKYIAIGNSLTSGFMDGTLYASAQKNSYPSMIASGMKLCGGGDFVQPLMPDDIGGFKDLGVAGKYELKVMPNGSLAPVATVSVSNLTPATSGPFNNMGVPGAKSYHLLYNGYGNPTGLLNGTANPFFVRMASNPTASILEDVLVQNPTFFSLWIGANDVLGYATSGGQGDTITGIPVFGNAYGAIVNQLTANGAKGVLANIPNVSTIPYFTTVPYNPLVLRDGQVDTVNGLFTFIKYNTIMDNLDPSRKVTYTKGVSNPLLVEDKSLTNLSTQIASLLIAAGISQAEAGAIGFIYGSCRQAKSTDLILLTASGVIGKADSSLIQLGAPASMAIQGITAPLKDKYSLNSTEIANINNATSSFNSIIAGLATSKGLALYDASSDMKRLVSGMMYNANVYSPKFVSGGAFSLDGVHLNSRGYAIIANGFINSINSKYGSTIPLVNPNMYPGIVFP